MEQHEDAHGDQRGSTRVQISRRFIEAFCVKVRRVGEIKAHFIFSPPQNTKVRPSNPGIDES